QRDGAERRLHRGTGGVGAGVVERSADETDDRHGRDGEDHRDIALVGAGKPAGGRTNATENGYTRHGCSPKLGFMPAISGCAAKQVVNRCYENRVNCVASAESPGKARAIVNTR